VRQWVAGLVRERITAEAVVEAAATVLGRKSGATSLRESR
jgi:hypothetical protein